MGEVATRSRPATLTRDETRRVRGVLYLCGVARDDVDDCMQDVALRLLRQPAPPAETAAWACVVAANLARDRARTDARRDQAVRRLRRERVRDADDLALRRAVVDALATLPEDLRHVLVLRCYGDLTVAEIAVATGVPEGTVKSRLHRAAAVMRDALPREHWR